MIDAESELDQFSLSGVRLEYLDAFVEKYGGRAKLTGLTTTDVCEQYVKPKHTKSICEHLLDEDSPMVGTAACFISHAWSYAFLDTVDAIKHHFEALKQTDVIIWFDLFSNSQHDTSTKPFAWWSGTFRNAIAKLGSMVMILTPWDKPITLTRAW